MWRQSECIWRFGYAISESSSSDYIDTAPVRPSSSATETAANDGYDNADTYDDTDVGITTDDSSESDDTSSSSFTSESSPTIYRMVEVQWTDASYMTYRALIVIMTDFSGLVKVKYVHPQLGLLWITEGATLTNYTDVLLSLTVIIRKGIMHQDTRQTTSRYFPMEHGIHKMIWELGQRQL